MKLLIFFLGAFVSGISAQAETYMVGGEDIDYYGRPSYMLSLRQSSKHICGAVAVSSSWALTAADCVRDKKSGFIKPYLSVRAGTLGEEKGTLHNINLYRFHPNYNKNTGEFNFALIKVFNAFSSVSPPLLPSCHTEPADYLSAKIYGWGEEYENGQNSGKLKQGQVFIIPRHTCDSIPPKNQFETTSAAKLICAASAGIGTCVGDEGGPLMFNNLLLGIATVGKSCADPYKPSVFGNIGNYYVRTWITNEIK